MVAFLEQVQDQVALILSITGIAAIAGSMLSFNRQKVALEASESAGRAWRDERDAAVAWGERSAREAREAEALRLEAMAKATALEALPNLTSLQLSIAHLAEAVERHEVNAEARTSRLVEALASRNDQLSRVIDKLKPTG